MNQHSQLLSEQPLVLFLQTMLNMGSGVENRIIIKRSPPYSFLHQSQPICKEMFLNLYGISKSQFQNKQSRGISQVIRGNSKRLLHDTLPLNENEDVKNFLSNYAEENAVLLPGRIPGFKNEDIQLLSSSDTETYVWK